MPKVSKLEKNQRMVDALEAGKPWAFIEGERPYLDLIAVIDGNYVMRCPSVVIGKMLGWSHSKLSPRRDDIAELIGREPIMTLWRGSRIVNGYKNDNMLISDIFDAMRYGYAWDVNENNSFGRVRLLPEVEHVSRTYRVSQLGVLAVDANDENKDLVGAQMFYLFPNGVDLRKLFEEAEARCPEPWVEEEEGLESFEDEWVNA